MSGQGAAARGLLRGGVGMPPVLRAGAQPVDWWWCSACKLAHAAKDAPKTATQKKLAEAAKGCRRLDVAWAGR